MTGCMTTALNKPLRTFLEWKEHTTQQMWGMSYEGVTQLHFCEEGNKMYTAKYRVIQNARRFLISL